MGRSISITKSDIEYLRVAVEKKITYNRMAEEIGCCPDTLKRLLVREGLASFEGAKYGMSLRRERLKTESLWQRPCMICKDTKPRPVGQYVCDKCHRDQEDLGRCGDRWADF